MYTISNANDLDEIGMSAKKLCSYGHDGGEIFKALLEMSQGIKMELLYL